MAGELALWVKALTAKPEEPRLTSRSHADLLTHTTACVHADAPTRQTTGIIVISTHWACISLLHPSTEALWQSYSSILPVQRCTTNFYFENIRKFGPKEMAQQQGTWTVLEKMWVWFPEITWCAHNHLYVILAGGRVFIHVHTHIKHGYIFLNLYNKHQDEGLALVWCVPTPKSAWG